MFTRSARSLVLASSVAALCASAVLFAQPGGGGGGGGGGGEGGRPAQPGQPGGRGRGFGGEGQSLEAAMKTMGAALKSLETTAGDAAKKDEALTAVGMLQRGCLSSKSIKPAHLKGADLAKAQEEYRRDQIKLMTMALELETQILDGKTKEASASVEKIKKFRDDSHAKFEDDKKDKGKGGEGKDPAPKKPDDKK